MIFDFNDGGRLFVLKTFFGKWYLSLAAGN